MYKIGDKVILSGHGEGSVVSIDSHESFSGELISYVSVLLKSNIKMAIKLEDSEFLGLNKI